MTNEERKMLESDLWTCQTIGDVFSYLSNYFDLFSKPIPVLYRAIIISGILSAIHWIQPTRKK